MGDNLEDNWDGAAELDCFDKPDSPGQENDRYYMKSFWVCVFFLNYSIDTSGFHISSDCEIEDDEHSGNKGNSTAKVEDEKSMKKKRKFEALKSKISGISKTNVVEEPQQLSVSDMLSLLKKYRPKDFNIKDDFVVTDFFFPDFLVPQTESKTKKVSQIY